MTFSHASEQQARAAHATARWYDKLAALLDKTTQRTALTQNSPTKSTDEHDFKQQSCHETLAANTTEQNHLAYTKSETSLSPIEDGFSMNSVLAVVINGLGNLDDDVRAEGWGGVSYAIVHGGFCPHQMLLPWPPPPPEAREDAKKHKWSGGSRRE
ncbi:hypothetical protein DM02DRAFT_628547 [Periconia macrospinosa]|uniref:Uncharacterized protein n=1 Tax=Periconia macrospinosa TaxID=97972 RepID=A0A2V1DQR8_9PLEO|nr:hypothetical protein DM02DRAFT_628547 [Periconia macrospinosa]